MSVPTSLYRIYDKDDYLLYVGISANALVRISQHSKKADWAMLMRHIKVNWFESRRLACAAEIEAIKSEKPQWNIQHNDGKKSQNPDFSSVSDVKDKLINIRVDSADYERWKAALEKDGQKVSVVCRSALERAAKRAEKAAEGQK